MQMVRALLQVVLLALLASTAYSRFVVEQGGIKVKFPVSARQKYPKGFDTSLANFGEVVCEDSVSMTHLLLDLQLQTRLGTSLLTECWTFSSRLAQVWRLHCVSLLRVPSCHLLN